MTDTKDSTMTSLTRLMIALSVAILPGFAMGHDYKVGDLHVEHPFARATPKTAMTGAGYLTILNSGTEDDTLVAIEADFPRVMMHDSATVDGIATMTQMDGVTIPAGGTVSFAPGGLHVMFMGLNGDPLEAGERLCLKRPAALMLFSRSRIRAMSQLITAPTPITKASCRMGATKGAVVRSIILGQCPVHPGAMIAPIRRMIWTPWRRTLNQA
jgi:copper(I)-binding protein